MYAQYGKAPENTEERTPPFNNNIASVEIPMINNSGNINKCFPSRCFLPVFKSMVLHSNQKVRATVLLDSGSELNVMSSKLYKKLILNGPPITINIIGVAGEVTQRKTNVVEVTIQDRLGFQTTLQCIVLDQACGKAIEVHPRILSIFGDNLPVPKEELLLSGGGGGGGGEIELLVGMTSPHLHQQLSLYGRRNELMIIETRLGPSLVGRSPDTTTGNYESGVYTANNISVVEEKALLKFVEAETAGIRKECECQTKTDEELLFENFMKDAWSNDAWSNDSKLRWKASEKIAVFFNFIENPKHTHSYAKFIVDSISENRFNVSCL